MAVKVDLNFKVMSCLLIELPNRIVNTGAAMALRSPRQEIGIWGVL
jgi:hypothetical protein